MTVLVNNVAVLEKAMFSQMPWDKIEGTMHVNMDSMLELTYHFLSKSSKIRAIINVSSYTTLVPIQRTAIYAATKAFMNSLTSVLAMERKDVDILYVLPVFITTAMAENIYIPGVSSLPDELVNGSIRALGWDTESIGCAK